MSWALTARRAVGIAAAVAGMVYANSLANGWAGDDVYVVFDNPRVHSAGAALRAWFLSYWPPPYEGAGLYRPLTVLTYGIEWSLAGGQPWFFHLGNVLLHAAASGLVVAVALRWLPTPGALAAGVLFAVHPVHVEAVANVVGRAELLGAVSLLGAVLAARSYREAADPGRARRWIAISLGVVALGLLSKEHVAIAVAVLAVDHLLDPVTSRRSMSSLYLGIVCVTVAWFFVWRAIAGEYVVSGTTSVMYGLSWAERVSHMMPVQLDLVRLLAWPMDLAGDYGPDTIPLRTHWSGLAWVGSAVAASLIALAFALARPVPAIAFGLLVAAGSYAPTSNLFFPSGVVLAERVLYLAVLAPALAFGWLCTRLAERPYRRLGGVAAVLLIVVFAGRSIARAPYFKDPPTAVIEDAADHAENFREHLYLGDLVAFGRDTARALAEYLTAAALAPHDPFVGRFTVRTAIAMGRPQLAVAEALRVHQLAPDNPQTGRWLTRAYAAAGQHDSAIAVAGRDARRRPAAIGLIRTYQLALRDGGAPLWRRQLIDVTEDWLSGRLVQASARLDSLGGSFQRAARAPSFCDDFGIVSPAVRALNPALVERARDAAMRAGRACTDLG